MLHDIEERTVRPAVVVGIALLAIGMGHLIIVTVLHPDVPMAWIESGFFATVSLIDPAPSVDTLTGSVVFWSGVGGFSVPVILIGALVLHLSRRQSAPPAWLGWTLGAWGLVSGALLDTPTPFLLLPVLGATLVVTHHRASRAPTPS